MHGRSTLRSVSWNNIDHASHYSVACQIRDLPQVYVPSHPLVKHWLAVARNELSPPPVFRGAIAELGRLLIYEASAEEGWLPVLEGQAETPCGIADVAFLDPGRPVKAC